MMRPSSSAFPPSLRSDRLLLRPHEPADIAPLLEAVRASAAELSPWLPWCHAGMSVEEIAGFVAFSRESWEDGSHFHFAILDGRSGALLGGISLAHIVDTNRLANMGYWVRTSATRGGIASEAVRLVAAYGFGPLQLSRIEIAVIPANLASRRVAEKSGARLEAIARNRIVMHGRPHDAALYSLVPEDLAPRADS